MPVDTQIKSRSRVRDLGEVFTGETEVNAMLDLVGDLAYDPSSRFLEPACGNGNFLVEILQRKLVRADTHYRKTRRKRTESREAFEFRRQDEYEFLMFIAVTSIYGIDISPENVEQARKRLSIHTLEHCTAHPRNALKPSELLPKAIDDVLGTNIVVGDSLNHLDQILLTEYTFPGTDVAKSVFAFKVQPRKFTYDTLVTAARAGKNPKPVKVGRLSHYLEVSV